jgi:hypothetical protein
VKIGLDKTQVQYCSCNPAAVTLVKHGFFPCSPIQPSVAFDINLLDLVSITAANMAPNIFGWTLSLESFWAQHGYTIGIRVSFLLIFQPSPSLKHCI